MLETVLDLIGLDLSNFNIDDNLLFVVLSLFLLFCLGYMFNFFQTFMERMTSKKGR